MTKQEAIDFAKNLEKTIAEKNPDVFNNLFDPGTIKRRIKDASNGMLTDKMLAEIPAALKKKRLGDELVQSIGKDGMYQLVKSYEKDEKQHLIFRLFSSDGLNYHDIELVHAGKEVKAADMFIYVTGENMSKSFADVLLQITDYYKTRSDEQDIVKLAAEIRKFISQEKFDEALLKFESLPQALKKQKLFQLLHVQITSNFENDIYKEALEQYERLFPHEPGMHILFLDIHFLHEEYDKALEDVNKMDSLINKDPFLDYYRGLIYKAMENDATSLTYFEKLYKNMPEFSDGILELIQIYSKTGEKEKAKALVKAYKKDKKFDKETLDMMYVLYPGIEK